jgi:hypothetical protein
VLRKSGYDVTHGKFEMGEDRKAEIMKMEFPKGTKKMHSFLVSALFFKNFIINYSDLTAKLTEMTHKDFNWDEKTWIFGYRGDFDKLKDKIRQCVTIHFPDYTLVWILRTDTSDVACGVVLLQVYVAPRGDDTSADHGKLKEVLETGEALEHTQEGRLRYVLRL